MATHVDEAAQDRATHVVLYNSSLFSLRLLIFFCYCVALLLFELIFCYVQGLPFAFFATIAFCNDFSYPFFGFYGKVLTFDGFKKQRCLTEFD